jgi:hypothetical protein
MSQENVLDDFVVSIELTVKEVNTLLNVLNTPNQIPTTTLVAFINLFQQQAAPQVLKAQENLKAVAKAKDEPKTTS